jgi:arsenical pump membrane protein
MLIFIATIFLVFKHPTVRIPFTSKYLRIDYGSAPIVGVIILFLTLSIGIDTIARGIIGSDGLKPYSIIILIISLSYICVSLDFTGFFEYLSLRVARASRNSGKRLFVYLFLLTAFLTLFTDNDIVILTMTLIIFYVSKNAGLDPIPFLFAQFFAVNILGMALYIGNPTNIVAADAQGLSFAEFARWMFLPSAIAAATCLVLLWLVFRRRIPDKFKTLEIDPHLAIKNRTGALFGSIVLACTVFFMSLPTSWTGIPPWAIALFFAIVMFLHDVVSYRSGIPAISSRMPWRIVPFLIGFFILVESLASAGWIDLFASQLSKISGSSITTTLGICFLSSLAAGIMNNHPMTIFFVKSFQSPSFMAHQTARLGSTLALIAGSNFGANFTLMGALAGLMWAKILSDKGCSISFSEFSKHGFLVMPFVVVVACLTLTMELVMWG